MSVELPKTIEDSSMFEKSIPLASGVIPLPDQLELVLDESEQASARPSQRNNDLQVQFESEGLPSHRTGSSAKSKVETLLKLKKDAMTQDLISIVQEMAESRDKAAEDKSAIQTQ